MNKRCSFLAGMLLCLLPVAAKAVDLTTIDRTIKKEPAYHTLPGYCLLVFGADASKRVWLVHDGKRVYVDFNGNGDLTEAGEWLRGSGRVSFSVPQIAEADGTTVHRYLHLWAYEMDQKFSISMRLHSGLEQSVGKRSRYPKPRFAGTPQDAPIIHLNGPMTLVPDARSGFLPRQGREYHRSLRAWVGTPGLGPGTFATFDSEQLCEGGLRQVTVDFEFPGAAADDEPIARQQSLPARESSDYIYCGPFEVPAAAGVGAAQVKLSVAPWKGREIEPAVFPAVLLGDPKDLSTAAAALMIGDAIARKEAWLAIHRFRMDRDAVYKRVVQRVADPDPQLRTAAVHGLNTWKTPEVFAMLKQAVEDEAASVRVAALKAMAAYEDQRAATAEKLIKALSDPDPLVRRVAAFHLRDDLTDGADAVEALITVLDDEDGEVRHAALGSLTAHGEKAKQAVPEVTRRLHDPDPGVSVAAIAALAAIDRSAIGPIIGRLKNSPKHARKVQLLAAAALQAMNPDYHYGSNKFPTSIRFYKSLQINNDDLLLLLHLPNIELLKQMRSLSLRSTQADDEGLGQIIPGLSQICNLSLSERPISNDGLKHVATLKSLKILDLSGTRLTDDGLAQIEGLKHIDTLYLSDTQLTDAGLARLSSLPRLRYLRLSGTQVTDAGAKQIAQRLPQLNSLSISNTTLTDQGLRHIARLRRVHSLTLGGTKITDAGLAHLQRLSYLRGLSLEGSQITSAGLRRLAAIPLTSLTLDHSAGIDDMAVEHLAKFHELTQLLMKGTKLTDEGAAELRRRLPKLRVLTHGKPDGP